MIKGIGSILSRFCGDISKTLTIPINFSSPITDSEWQIVEQEIYNRLNAYPIKAIIHGDNKKELVVTFAMVRP